MSKLRILIADDHEIVRTGVRSLLESEPDCEICGEAVTGLQAVTLAQQLQPDVVILDVTMPDLDGLEATRKIREIAPGVQILILSMHESEELVREVLNAGAHGYILKSDAGRELIVAMQALRKRETFFTSRVAQIALRAYRTKKAKDDTPTLSDGALTSREREVLQLLAEGRSNKETATALGIGVATVETHRANIMRKLGVHSVAELVHYAVRNKMITP
jgi:DNA-binding NarL/FixJ family response regulator